MTHRNRRKASTFNAADRGTSCRTSVRCFKFIQMTDCWELPLGISLCRFCLYVYWNYKLLWSWYSFPPHLFFSVWVCATVLQQRLLGHSAPALPFPSCNILSTSCVQINPGGAMKMKRLATLFCTAALVAQAWLDLHNRNSRKWHNKQQDIKGVVGKSYTMKTQTENNCSQLSA